MNNKRKRAINGRIAAAQKEVKRKLKLNWENSLTYNGEKFFFNNVPLLSVSTLLKGLNSVRFAVVPKSILETAQQEGQAVTEWLQYIHENEVRYEQAEQLDYSSEKVKQMVLSVFRYLAANDLRIMYVEKHISNGRIHGFIDLVVMDKKRCLVTLLEIKTRGNNEVYDSDILQLATYGRMLSKEYLPCYILIVNKRTFEVTTKQVKLNAKQVGVANKFIKMFLNDNYLI